MEGGDHVGRENVASAQWDPRVGGEVAEMHRKCQGRRRAQMSRGKR